MTDEDDYLCYTWRAYISRRIIRPQKVNMQRTLTDNSVFNRKTFDLIADQK